MVFENANEVVTNVHMVLKLIGTLHTRLHILIAFFIRIF